MQSVKICSELGKNSVNKETVEVCEILYQNGFFTLPIIPPTVPEGTSRLRLSLTTKITEKEIEDAIFLAKQTK